MGTRSDRTWRSSAVRLAVREALLGSGLVEDDRTIANYRSLAEIEVVNTTRGTVPRAARTSTVTPLLWGEANPRAAERAATYIFLASIVGTLRPGGRRGASALKSRPPPAFLTLCSPSPTPTAIVEELVNPDTGMCAVEIDPGQGNNKPARYYLSTRLTHRMLVNNISRTITEAERDAVIARVRTAAGQHRTVPRTQVRDADPTRTPADVLSTAGIDTAHTTTAGRAGSRSVQPAQRERAVDRRRADRRDGPRPRHDQLPVQWAQQLRLRRRQHPAPRKARGMAAEFLAGKKALAAPEVQADDDLQCDRHQGTRRSEGAAREGDQAGLPACRLPRATRPRRRASA